MFIGEETGVYMLPKIFFYPSCNVRLMVYEVSVIFSVPRHLISV